MQRSSPVGVERPGCGLSPAGRPCLWGFLIECLFVTEPLVLSSEPVLGMFWKGLLQREGWWQVALGPQPGAREAGFPQTSAGKGQGPGRPVHLPLLAGRAACQSGPDVTPALATRCFPGCGLWPSGPTRAALCQELLQSESEPV